MSPAWTPAPTKRASVRGSIWGVGAAAALTFLTTAPTAWGAPPDAPDRDDDAPREAAPRDAAAKDDAEDATSRDVATRPEAPTSSEPLSPVATDDFLARAPNPQWNVGLVGGIAGVSQSSFWQSTEFYGRVTGDVTFFRRRDADWAFGATASLTTIGFLDTRPSLGLTLVVPTIDPVVLELAAGGLVQIDGRGASPGFEASLGFGLRALNLSDHYGLTHTLVLGVQHTFGDDPRASTAATLGLRVDGFWFVAPFGALF